VTVTDGILATTLTVTHAPATNLDTEGGGGWRYVLPTLEPAHVLCLGAPDVAQLTELSELAGRVTVHDRSVRVRRLERSWQRRHGTAGNVTFRSDPVPGDEPDVDLVVAFRRRATTGRAGGRQGPAPAATYVERRGLRWRGGRGVSSPPAAGDRTTLWLAPPFGTVGAAAPMDDGGTSVGFLRAGGFDRSPGASTVPRKVLRRVVDHDLVRDRVVRTALLRDETGSSGTLPAYVRAAAARGGLDLQDRRWAMSAPGRYRSKKVVFFVFADDDTGPEHVVKLTRHPDLNHRLENEWDALTRLGELGIDGVPTPTFLDHHAGLALLGQRALAGVALRPALEARGVADATTAAAWFEQLAATSVRHVPATEAAAALADLVDRFEHLYRPGPDERAQLRAHLRTVGDHPDPFPLVFQHGDPGAWNALTTPDGGLAFLDWEAADPYGMPLWDLLYFLRSYGVGAARATGGPRDALSAFTRVYLEGSVLAELLPATVGSYGARIGLDPRLVTPLYHLCWLHRAVKEATRLPAEQLGTGHYVRLLRHGLRREVGSELAHLLTGGRLPVR
jgi:hypothetical protein